MGWEYSDTNCEFASVCSLSPRCTTKGEKECQIYKKDERSFWEKMFPPRYYYDQLREAYKYREENQRRHKL